MIHVPIRKNCTTDFQNFDFNIFEILHLGFVSASAVSAAAQTTELSRPTGFTSL